MMNDQDFKYVLQDFSNIYIGARLTYGELVDQDDTPQRLSSAVYQIILKETDKENMICEHLFQIGKDDLSFMVYKKLKAQLKIVFPKSIVEKGKAIVQYETKTYNFIDFVQDEQLKNQIRPGQISEITFKKRHLLSVGI